MIKQILTQALLSTTTVGILALPAHALEIEHAMGSTDVSKTKRVVILTNEGTEALLALGVKPVGAANSWNGEPWYPHITEQMGDAEPVGKESAIDLEAIASLEPDLIIGNKLRQEKHYEHLSAIAPTVFSETLKGQWKNNFMFYAKVVGQEELGKELLAEYFENARRIKKANIMERISVVRFLPGQARIYKEDSFSGQILQDANFKRMPVAYEAGFVVKLTNKERIPEMDGDRIFYFTWDKGDGKGVAFQKEWQATMLWKNLGAVKAGKVHQISDTIWNTSGGIISAKKMQQDLIEFYNIP